MSCIHFDCLKSSQRSRFDVPYDCSVELSPLGNQFLTDIFEAYDKASSLIVRSRFRLRAVCRTKMAPCPHPS